MSAWVKSDEGWKRNFIRYEWESNVNYLCVCVCVRTNGWTNAYTLWSKCDTLCFCQWLSMRANNWTFAHGIFQTYGSAYDTPTTTNTAAHYRHQIVPILAFVDALVSLFKVLLLQPYLQQRWRNVCVCGMCHTWKTTKRALHAFARSKTLKDEKKKQFGSNTKELQIYPSVILSFPYLVIRQRFLFTNIYLNSFALLIDSCWSFGLSCNTRVISPTQGICVCVCVRIFLLNHPQNVHTKQPYSCWIDGINRHESHNIFLIMNWMRLQYWSKSKSNSVKCDFEQEKRETVCFLAC